jgi:uncharacterized protein YajQ (UPF0234 family)
MPSFDVVSEVDTHQLTNAVDQVKRVIKNRFDFKGVEASFALSDHTIDITAEADFHLEQMVDMLRASLIKCSIDPKAMEVGDEIQSGKIVKQAVTLKHGLSTELCKKIVKIIKEEKMKVQSAIQGDHVRVTAKKRDDLQQVMALLREQDLEQPLQFDNFRD